MSWTDPRANEGSDLIGDPDPEDLDEPELEDTGELEPQEED